MLKVNAMGDTCPIPVVKTKEAIRQLGADGGVVETLVDNDIAVQNLTKMANQKGYGVESEKLGENEYRVTMTVGAGADLPAESEETVCMVPAGRGRRRAGQKPTEGVSLRPEPAGKPA